MAELLLEKQCNHILSNSYQLKQEILNAIRVDLKELWN